MAFDELSLCNAALIKCGAEPVAALDGTSKSARLVAARYEDAVTEVLNAHPWNCAEARVELSAEEEPADNGWYLYEIPEDCVRVLSITNVAGEPLPWVREGDFVLCPEEEAWAVYTKEMEIADLDPSVYEVAATRLASEIAYALTGSRTMMDQLEAQYERKLASAKNVDGREHASQPTRSSSWLDARGS